jgi:glutaredoxin-like protein NrdH
MRHPDSGEHLQAPVVIAGDRHWSGFRPDHIADLAHDAA